MMRLRILAALGLGLAVAACSSLPAVAPLPPRDTVVDKARQTLEADGSPAIVEVPVGKGILVSRSVREPPPPSVAGRRISISFPAGEATLDRLVAMLTVTGVRTVTRFEVESDARMLNRPLPFRAFSGTFGELVKVLEAGMGIVSWWQGGTLFLSDNDRFAFSVPQNAKVIESIIGDLKSLGATEITQSLRGGQIVYTAPPSLQTEVIGPYIDRIHRNMAMIKVQVAVVTLGISDQSASGFDWNAFSLKFNSSDSSTSSTSTSTAALSVAAAKSVKVLGVSGVLNVAGAISLLSTFGNTDIRQNAEVNTLSGAEVTLRAGQTIPYVSGVGVSTTGTTTTSSSSLLGSAQTSTVNTGLSVRLTPLFDSDSQLITIDLNVLVNSVVEFRELSAGTQVGTFTQPVTQEQSLNDIVRVLAGNTVVLGGLQIDSATFSNNDATPLRELAGGGASGLGKRSQDIKREALFIILRPTVTVFREVLG